MSGRLRVNAPPWRWGSPPPPGVLARVRVMLSRSVITYSTPSAPLAGASRLRRMAVYTRRLRCAGAPRRPTSGSELSLSILSRHAALYDPGEFRHRHGPVLRCRTWPSPGSEQLGTPIIPAIRFAQGTSFGASRFTSATACRFARPPVTDQTRSLPGPRGLLLPGFRQVGRPSCRWI